MTPVNHSVQHVFKNEINDQESYYPALNSITPVPSQSILVMYARISFIIHLDSGATVSFIRLETARRLSLDIKPNGQLALLADEKTRLQSLGEINVLVYLGHIVLRVRALVVKHLQVECYAGTTFHVDNSVEPDISTGVISFHKGKFKVKQHNPIVGDGPVPHPPPFLTTEGNSADMAQCAAVDYTAVLELSQQVGLLRSELGAMISGQGIAKDRVVDMPLAGQDDTKCSTIHVMARRTVPPGGSYQLKLNAVQAQCKKIAIIPQFSRPDDRGSEWQPQICAVDEGGHATYQNRSRDFLTHSKGVHFNMIPVTEVSKKQALQVPKTPFRGPGKDLSVVSNILDNLKDMKINTDILSIRQQERLQAIHVKNIKVFDDDLNVGFEGYEAKLNFKVEQQAPPFKLWVPQYNKKCQDLLQSKCDQLECQGVLTDPIKNNITVRNVSPCFIQQKARAKHKKLEDCSLEEIRFISDFNVLNESIRAIPSRSNSYDDIVKFLARHKYFIFADLLNSYFQVRVGREDWKHLAILTPHRGLKLMTRLGQGLLNSDVVLDQVMAQTLGDEISAGFCLAARDDLFVGGDTLDETISNWELVLGKLGAANLKITARKVRIFLEDTEVFGHRISNGTVSPSDHNVKTLGEMKMDDIRTNKQMNSYKGLYKTLSRHLPDMASMMAPFDKATAGKLSAGRFDWEADGHVAAFNRAQNQLEKINTTYLPRPEEKLYLLPDTASEDICTGWVLYTERETSSGLKRLPVQFCTAKLSGYMANWHPCEQEGIGAVLAIDQCRHWINESHQPTSVLCDNKPVVEAAQLLKLGRHSKSPRLQSLLASVNRSNVEFYHNSAKRGHHVVPDSLSRLKKTCGAKDCQIERFLDDIPAQIQCMATTIMANPNMYDVLFGHIELVNLAATTAQLSEILCKGRGPIPLGSRAAWLEIQRSNEQCRQFLDQVKYGQLPRKRDKMKNNLNKMWKNCSIENDLIVCKSFDDILMKERSRVFVPAEFLQSILTVMHVRLDHVSSFQLEKVFNRYFFGISTKTICDEISEECSLCISLQKFPKELDEFHSGLDPEHPGTHMNADVMARAGQKILVTTDMFSGYTTACIIETEQRDAMAEGIVQTVTYMRNSPSIQVRSDKAPSLRSLVKNQHRDLIDNGISIILGDDMNKNSNCCVDKKIQELQIEIKRLCPHETKINLSTLSKAVTNLNSRIRNQGLSSSQIHFSRDLVTGENLNLDDKRLGADKSEKRQTNQVLSAHSKAPRGKVLTRPEVQPGSLFYIKSQGSKHECRDPYMVTGMADDKVVARKMLHTAQRSDAGPAISPEVCKIDPKFIFLASKHKLRSDGQTKQRLDQPYIIPQRRLSQSEPVQRWVSKQDCEIGSDGDGDFDWSEDDETPYDDMIKDEVVDDSFVVGDTFTIGNNSGLDRGHVHQDDQGVDDVELEVDAGVDIDGNVLDATDTNSFEETDDDIQTEYILRQTKIKRGSKILMFSKARDTWIKVKTTSKYNTSDPVEQQKGEYWNYRLTDGTTDGAYFKSGQHWGVLAEDDWGMNPDDHLIVLQQPADHVIPQHDGPVLTPASLSPMTSAECSLNSSLVEPFIGSGPVHSSTPLPVQDPAFRFRLPVLNTEVVFLRNETPGEAMSPGEHMRFLRRSYFPAQRELETPVVRYHRLHCGDENDEVAELETAFCDISGLSEDAGEAASAEGATGGFSAKFLSSLNPFKKGR